MNDDIVIKGEKDVIRFFKKEIGRVENTLEKINELYTSDLPAWERFSIKVSKIGGSWGFIITYVAILTIWFVSNMTQYLFAPFDPYPFALLNMITSALAVVQAPIILMAQNRFAKKDQARMEMDLEKDMRDLHIDQQSLKLLLKMHKDIAAIKRKMK